MHKMISALQQRITGAEFVQKNMEEKLSAIFTSVQIKRIKRGTKRMKWAEEDISHSITLYSAKMYRVLKKRGFRYQQCHASMVGKEARRNHRYNWASCKNFVVRISAGCSPKNLHSQLRRNEDSQSILLRQVIRHNICTSRLCASSYAARYAFTYGIY